MATVSTPQYSTSDLASIPDISFGFVEEVIGRRSSSSGKEQMNKGFKYYSEQYIHSITVHQNQENDVSVKAKCFRSQKRNDCPHDLKVIFTGHEPQIEASCSCTIGLSGKCGHIAALLYQLAYFKQRNFKLIPADVAKTSLPQAWHIPRGEKLHGSKADDVVVYGYDRENPHRPTRGIKSTLYNPLPSDFQQDCDAVLDHFTDMNIMFNTVAGNTSEMVQTNFGRQQKGCVLSYQQKLSSEYLVNFVDVATFPELPVRNTMINNINTVLNEKQTKLFESLKMSQSECQEVEEFTRLQSNDLRWHKIRSQRITASNAGEIAKRRADGSKLAERLQSTRRVLTAAMKRGIECEAIAASAYSKVMNDAVNLYPCGVVVSPHCHWLAATPDRKVYCPERDLEFGLLEIKCPNTDSLSNVKCLRETGGKFELKKNDNYHYQVQMQMAVTGLEWCDFFVWLENEVHLQTIEFDPEFWAVAKDKLDLFYFEHYLK